MSDHKCIFCGKDATNKTKEHVIPQWLIRMTGDHRRIANFGTDFNQIINSDGNKAVKPRMFSFNSLTFPACRDCNEKYGKILENNAFTILNKIMNEELISETEIMHFMDWLDKIRIGLWLGFDILNQNPFDVKHKFYLEKRIGYHDRILLVYRASKNDLPNGINFIGPDTPAFAFLPCCLTIRINNFFFFNVSKENILLEKLGFPFLERFVLNNELNPIKIKINEGHKKISTPILNFFTIDTSVKIFQPIYKAYINDIDCNEEYIKNNSFNCKEGLGNIFSEYKIVTKFRI